MIAEKMIPFVQNNSAIRTMFEEGIKYMISAWEIPAFPRLTVFGKPLLIWQIMRIL
mgnify:CR=1 FL=1